MIEPLHDIMNKCAAMCVIKYLLLFQVSSIGMTVVFGSDRCSHLTWTSYVCKELESIQNSLDPNRDQQLNAVYELINQGVIAADGEPAAVLEWQHMKWFYFLLLDDHNSAAEALEYAVDLFDGTDQSVVDQFETYKNLALSYLQLGNIVLARSYRRNLVDLAITHQLERLPNIYYALGESYRQTGELSAAKSYFLAAEEIFSDRQSAYGQALIDNKKGTIARIEGNVDEAIGYHQASINHFVSDYPYRALVAELELAKDHFELGELTVAYEIADRLWRDVRLLTQHRIDAGVLLMEIGNARGVVGKDCGADYPVPVKDSESQLEEPIPEPDECRAFEEFSINAKIEPLTKLLELNEKTSSVVNKHAGQQLRFYEASLDYYARVNNFEKVAEYGDRGIALINYFAKSLRGNNENFFGWMAKTQRFMSFFVSSLYQDEKWQKKIPDLLDARYDWRNRSDVIRSSQTITRAIESGEIARLREVTRAQQALLNQLAGEAYTNINEEREVPVADLVEHRRGALDAYLRAEGLRDSVDYLWLDELRKPVDLMLVSDETENQDSSVRILDTDLVLRYFVQDQVSFVIAMVGDEKHFFDQPMREEARKIIASSLEKVNNRNISSNVRSVALAQLRQFIPFEFINKHKKISRIIVIPDDATHLIPYSAINLSQEGVEDNYIALGERYEIVRTHSLSAYYSSAPQPLRAVNSNADIAIFANPFIERNDQSGGSETALNSWFFKQEPLPFTAQEAEQIRRAYQKKKVVTFVGEKATSSVLKSPLAREAQVLHIATHGYFDETNPSIVGLMTARAKHDEGTNNGFFSIKDLLGQTYSSRLVIISGCDTMRGREIDGLGAKSMAQLFLARGAGAAIGTLWKVPDQGTAYFMKLFYEALEQHNGNSSIALKIAKQRMAKTRRYYDPIYWAGFVMDSTNYRIDQEVFY